MRNMQTPQEYASRALQRRTDLGLYSLTSSLGSQNSASELEKGNGLEYAIDCGQVEMSRQRIS